MVRQILVIEPFTFEADNNWLIDFKGLSVDSKGILRIYDTKGIVQFEWQIAKVEIIE